MWEGNPNGEKEDFSSPLRLPNEGLVNQAEEKSARDAIYDHVQPHTRQELAAGRSEGRLQPGAQGVSLQEEQQAQGKGA